MDKIMNLIYKFFNVIFWRLILLITIFSTFKKASILGHESEQITIKYGILSVSNLEAGFGGGAIGFSFVCATCIIMYTWIEISNK